MSMRFSTTGVENLDRLLKGLPQQVSHRILGAAHADAAKPLIPAAQSRIRKKTGNLERSIGTEKVAIKKSNQVGLVLVGPRRKRGYKGQHGHLVEFGHAIRFTKGGRSKGWVSEKPFMRPAFQSTKDLIVGNIKSSLSKKLLAYLKRNAK